MRRGLLVALLVLVAAPARAGAAGAPAVDVLVAGRTETLQGPTTLEARAAKVTTTGGRRCSVAAATPLAVLLEVGKVSGLRDIRVRDFGHCSPSGPRNSGSLFVSGVAADRNRGRDGWVYKVGRKVGSTGAADLSGPFGNGRRLRAGDRVAWFWCRMRSSGCQRTLEVALPAEKTIAGGPVRITVRGYDDNGRGKVVSGATVHVGSLAEAKTDATGVATLTAPGTPGRYFVSADAPGLVPSFAATLTVSAP